MSTREEKNSTVGGRLTAEREGRLRLSQEKFGSLLGVSREMVGKYERDQAMPGGEVLQRLAELGADVLYVLTGRPILHNSGPLRSSAGGTMDIAGVHSNSMSLDSRGDDFILVPRYDVRASAGHGALVSSEQVVDHLAFREEWVRNALGVAQKDLALITVKGDSMEPTLSNEDLILIDMRANSIGDNSIYVIRNDGQLLVKRVQRKLDGTIIIKSDNAAYDPETIDAKAGTKLKVVGRVVWAGRRL